MVAVRGAVYEGSSRNRELYVVSSPYSGLTRGHSRGIPVTDVLRKITIWGSVLILLMSAYSVGFTLASHSHVSKSVSSNASPVVDYTVQPGDSPWSIAARFALSPGQVTELTSEIAGSDGSTTLRPGMVIRIVR